MKVNIANFKLEALLFTSVKKRFQIQSQVANSYLRFSMGFIQSYQLRKLRVRCLVH